MEVAVCTQARPTSIRQEDDAKHNGWLGLPSTSSGHAPRPPGRDAASSPIASTNDATLPYKVH